MQSLLTMNILASYNILFDFMTSIDLGA